MFLGRPSPLFILLALLAVWPEAGAQRPSPAQQPKSTQQSKQAQPPVDRPQSDEQQNRIRRLILKDGSFELISQHRIKGDRVQYYSSERREWEEIPYSLVDWPATEKYAKEAAAEKQSLLRELAETEAKERVTAETQTPLVSPGIRLPAAGGVFLLDLYQGKPELNQLNQSGADINKNMGGNILRGIINPIASAKQMIELKGLHAAIQSHVTDPSIYVSIDPEDPSTDYTPETAKDHFRIVRCEEKKGNRVVGMLNIAVYGKVKQDAKYVEIKVEPVSGRWVKISPAAPLSSGEYALVELLGKQEINTFVWDFGVNTAAPANTGSLKPQPAKANEPPVLMKRKSQ
jgi:hypothetical protein